MAASSTAYKDVQNAPADRVFPVNGNGSEDPAKSAMMIFRSEDLRADSSM